MVNKALCVYSTPLINKPIGL